MSAPLDTESAKAIAEAMRIHDDEDALESAIGFVAEVLDAVHNEVPHELSGMVRRAEKLARALPDLVAFAAIEAQDDALHEKAAAVAEVHPVMVAATRLWGLCGEEAPERLTAEQRDALAVMLLAFRRSAEAACGEEGAAS